MLLRAYINILKCKNQDILSKNVKLDVKITFLKHYITFSRGQEHLDIF